MFPDTDIPKDIFMRVQEEMLRRSNLHVGKKKRVYSSRYALSSMVICSKCGDIYRRIARTGDSEGQETVLFSCVKCVTMKENQTDKSGLRKGQGDEIPLFARIISVADAYDAMNSSRCYRKSLDTETIIAELTEGKGHQFDPNIADIAIQLILEEQQ